MIIIDKDTANLLVEGWAEDVERTVREQRKLAQRANELAAQLREQKQYAAAELFDRRAEALLCSAMLAEARGLSI